MRIKNTNLSPHEIINQQKNFNIPPDPYPWRICHTKGLRRGTFKNLSATILEDIVTMLNNKIQSSSWNIWWMRDLTEYEFVNVNTNYCLPIIPYLTETNVVRFAACFDPQEIVVMRNQGVFIRK
jgi:hypothetical protein